MESEARKAGWGQIRQYLVPLSQELPFHLTSSEEAIKVFQSESECFVP